MHHILYYMHTHIFKISVYPTK